MRYWVLFKSFILARSHHVLVLHVGIGLFLWTLVAKFNFRDFAVLFLVWLVYLVLPEVPLGPCWCCLMGCEVFPQHWEAAADYLLVREGCDETFLLVPLVALVSLGRWVRLSSLWVQRGFLDGFLDLRFSLSVLPASYYLSAEKGSPWPKKKGDFAHVRVSPTWYCQSPCWLIWWRNECMWDAFFH